jgi:hypothetical protein
MSGQLGVPVVFIAGLCTGAVIAALAAALWHQLRPALARLRYLLAAGLATGFAIAAGAIYLAIGAHFGAGGAESAPVSAPGGAEPGGARQGALPHLAASGATPVSRRSATTLAGAASTSADSAPSTSTPAVATPSAPPPDAPSTGGLERRVSSHPDDASAWLALAEQRGAQHDYAGARVAYARVAGLQAMSAQSWADYADVLSSLAGGSLSGEAGAAIDNALRLDAWNPKAMWLKASQGHEQHRDAEALVWWRRLRAVLPPDSPDLPLINAKIAEAESLTNRTPPPPALQMGR